jgi:hypothetical protein
MTQRHKELLERHKTGQKQGNIDFHQKKECWIKRLMMIRYLIANWLSQLIIVIINKGTVHWCTQSPKH